MQRPTYVLTPFHSTISRNDVHWCKKNDSCGHNYHESFANTKFSARVRTHKPLITGQFRLSQIGRFRNSVQMITPKVAVTHSEHLGQSLDQAWFVELTEMIRMAVSHGIRQISGGPLTTVDVDVGTEWTELWRVLVSVPATVLNGWLHSGWTPL